MLLLVGLLLGASTPDTRASVLSNTVERLGTSSSTFDDYDLLDRSRCAALPLIMNSLLPLPVVPSGKVGGDLGRPDGPLTYRTSALLMALRILTEHDEYGPITRREYLSLPTYREIPGGGGILKRDSLVRGVPSGRSRFYGYWLSHGTSYYGPTRTQRAIKAQWKTYVARFDCHKELSNRRWDASFYNG